MVRVTLNVDMGELPDEPEELYALASVVNIACGGHAGDARSIARSVEKARKHGTRIAAHPSYPDRANFGRVTMTIDPDALRESLRQQLQDLGHAGVSVDTVKPHGALYHDANKDPAIARALLDACDGPVSVVGPPGGVLRTTVEARAWTFFAEGFADRAYAADGSLVPRSQAGALIVDVEKAAAQALSLARSGLVQTICIHGDTPNAIDIARAVRAALSSSGLLA